MGWWTKTLCSVGDAAYRLARVTRTNSNWQPTSHHGEEAIKEAWDLMMARTRDLAINSPTGKRIADTLADLIVGSGIHSFAVPFSNSIIHQLDTESLMRAQIIQDLEYALESDDFFTEWVEHADADGDNNWHELERLACYELVNAGNAILLECSVPSPDRRIPLCYQVIERDQLDADKDRPAAPGQTMILNGIEYDGRNRKIAYHIFGAHPTSTYDYRGAQTSVRVPASRVTHVYLRFRPSQRTGTPWAQEAAQAIRDTDWYIGNELTSSALQAILTFIHKSPNHGNLAGLDDGLDDEDSYGNPLLKLGAGLIFRGGLDDSLEVAESKRPSRDAGPFIQEMRTEQAMGAGLSPSRLTRDYRSHSYTSARAAHLDDDAHIKPLQAFLASKLSLPVRRKVNAQAAAMGLYASVTPRQFRADIARLQKFEALGPGREQLDPEKETEASTAKLRAGLSTLQAENGRRQNHWVRILLQRAIEQNVTDALGLTLDFSKGQGGQVGDAKTETKEGSDAATDQA